MSNWPNWQSGIKHNRKNIIRIALTPLYTSFEDMYAVCERIIKIIKEREYSQKDNSMEGVT